jgi:hemoglobin/transferrin/lactoferrin receptor protein
VLIDGDRETNLWAGRSPLNPFVDVGSIERVEVVKGPASALYGTDALGGVINIITKDAALADQDQWQAQHTVNTRYSSTDNAVYGRYGLTAGGNGFGFNLGISGRDAQNYEDGRGNEVNNSQFENQSIDLGAKYCISERNELSASVRINAIDDQGIPQKNAQAPFSHYDQFDTAAYKLGYHGRSLGMWDKVKVKTFYVDQQRSFEGKFPSSQVPVSTLKENQIDTSALGASLEMGTSTGTRHQLVGGVEFVREETDSSEQQMVLRDSDQMLRKRTSFEPVPTAHRSHIGVFIQDDISVGDKLVVIAGGRYDHFTADADDVPYTEDRFDEQGRILSSTTEVNTFSRETDGAGSLNLGLLYRYTEHVHLTTNLGTGFRAPDIFERYSTRGGGSQMIIGNPSLDPEYSYNADTGIKTRFGRFTGDVNVYYTQVHNYIDTAVQDTSFVPGSDIDTYKYVNVQDAELYGFEATAKWELTKDMDLFGNVAYVAGKNRDTGERLNNIAPLHGTVGATWEKKIRRNLTAWIEPSADFYDRQDHTAPGESETPGYAIVNLAAGLRMPSCGPVRDLDLVLRVENLLDKYYRSHLRKDDRDYIPESGCNVITSIKFSF